MNNTIGAGNGGAGASSNATQTPPKMRVDERAIEGMEEVMEVVKANRANVNMYLTCFHERCNLGGSQEFATWAVEGGEKLLTAVNEAFDHLATIPDLVPRDAAVAQRVKQLCVEIKLARAQAGIRKRHFPAKVAVMRQMAAVTPRVREEVYVEMGFPVLMWGVPNDSERVKEALERVLEKRRIEVDAGRDPDWRPLYPGWGGDL